MSDAPKQPDPQQAARTMRFFGIVILSLFALYVVFMGVDGWGLEKQTSNSIVLGLEYSEGGKTYVTQIVNNRPIVMEQAKPDAYIVKLNLGGSEAAALVSPELFQSLAPGDAVEVTFQRRRLTGIHDVFEVRKATGGAQHRTHTKQVQVALTGDSDMRGAAHAVMARS